MEFTDSLFLWFTLAFFAVHAVLGWMRAGIFYQNAWLAWSSLLFYGVWYPPAIALLLFHAVLVRISAPLLDSARREGTRRLLLGILVAASLAPLIVFKYLNFFAGATGHGDHLVSLVLPVGISFFTFTAIGYHVDVYRRATPGVRRFSDGLLLLAFWPHLAAGPILRSANMLNNMRLRSPIRSHDAVLAVSLIAGGLVKKLLIADNIGAYVNWNLDYGVAGMNMLQAWATLLGFGAQIYADFSGYSDMAIGYALLMGFRLPANFNYPYRATTVTEFWRRWHISLSSWFRDYLYFPLGGSRHGRLRMAIALVFVFVVSGLWHGAAWGFLIWGFAHGAFLVAEKLAGRHYLKVPALLRWLVTLLVVTCLWAFFRLKPGEALALLSRLIDPAHLSLASVPPYVHAPILLFAAVFAMEHIIEFYAVDAEGFPIVRPGLVSFFSLAVLLPATALLYGRELPFIYFQF